MNNKALKCKMCKKIYMDPCNGKKAECPNNISVNRKVDPYKLNYSQFKKIKKKKVIPGINVLKKWIKENKAELDSKKVKPKTKKRHRLVEAGASKKRARL